MINVHFNGHYIARLTTRKNNDLVHKIYKHYADFDIKDVLLTE